MSRMYECQEVCGDSVLCTSVTTLTHSSGIHDCTGVLPRAHCLAEKARPENAKQSDKHGLKAMRQRGSSSTRNTMQKF